MPGKYNLTIYQGSTFSFSIGWKDDLDVPIDLTGYASRMQIRYGTPNGVVAADLTTENLGIEIDIIANLIIVNLTAEQTALLKAQPAVYDIEMIKGDVVVRLIEGRVKIVAEVTK